MFSLKKRKKKKNIEHLVTAIGAFGLIGSGLCIYAALFFPWEIVEDWLYLFMVVLAMTGFAMSMLEMEN